MADRRAHAERQGPGPSQGRRAAPPQSRQRLPWRESNQQGVQHVSHLLVPARWRLGGKYVVVPRLAGIWQARRVAAVHRKFSADSRPSFPRPNAWTGPARRHHRPPRSGATAVIRMPPGQAPGSAAGGRTRTRSARPPAHRWGKPSTAGTRPAGQPDHRDSHDSQQKHLHAIDAADQLENMPGPGTVPSGQPAGSVTARPGPAPGPLPRGRARPHPREYDLSARQNLVPGVGADHLRARRRDAQAHRPDQQAGSQAPA